ncbi:MAG TPA: J domain-containing protein [Vicinamibacterales bacterium]|nr:J domain-containing protein [Vicinamibacterales bacterium]
MPDTAAPVNLDALLDAYAQLGLAHDATVRDARRAYREMARRYHPDRVPPGAPGRGEATARMAAINRARALVHDAPLRHHPITRGSDPDALFTQADTDEALRRARGAHRVDVAVTTVAYVAMHVILMVVLVPVLHLAGASYAAAFGIALLIAAAAFAARRSIDPVTAVDGVAAFLRVVLTR